MRLRIGALEIIDPTPEELRMLIQECIGLSGSDAQVTIQKSLLTNDAPRDSVLLKTLVDAGMTGIAVNKAGSILGRKGKAMRTAARDWAVRVGLSHDAASDPFDDCRIGTTRAIRIKGDLLDLARELLKKGGV